MTKTNLVFAITLATAFVLRGSLALAAAEAPPSHDYTVEVKPLTTVTDAVLGGIGLDLEGEKMINEHVAIFASVGAHNYHLGSKAVKAITDKKGSDYSFIQGSRGEGASLGARWYAEPAESTWYLSGLVSGQAEKDRWVRANQQLDADTTAYAVDFGAGYRWIWDGGFTLRLGAGARVGSTASRVLTVADAGGQDTTDLMDAAKKHYGTTTTVRLYTDLGLGWAF